MKKLIGYEYVDMTPEEIEEHNKLSENEAVAPPTENERLEALEMAMADMMIMQIGGTADD